MLGTLVESKPVKSRRIAGTLSSFLLHYGLVLVAIYSSAQATTVGNGPKQETVEFIEPKKDLPPEPEQPPAQEVAAPLPTKGIKLLIAPVEVPAVLPDIDLTQGVTDFPAFVRRGAPVAAANDLAPAGRPNGTDAYGELEVEKPVMPAPNSAAPAYPDMLRQAGVEGEALVSFVVDTTGRVEAGSFKVIRATHDLFAAAVRNALPRMRFIPAEVGSNKVRQLVQQPFSFALVK